MEKKISIFWFRRDLRLTDNAGLYKALSSGTPIVPIFIFDKTILDKLSSKDDARVSFIYQQIIELQKQLLTIGSSIEVYYGKPIEIYNSLVKKYEIESVYTNSDYEPTAIKRDKEVEELLKVKGIKLISTKDQVIFEKAEVVKDDGKPYTVFTPYSRKWKACLTKKDLASFPSEKFLAAFYKQKEISIPTLESFGFTKSNLPFPAKDWSASLIKKYKEQRDIPSIAGTSKLSVHLRFGTISIRELAREAGALNETYLNELIWRDFYQMILWHFPGVVDKAFKPAYDNIAWRNNESEFEAWCEGRTGYPIVDAGMRELNETGFMHNRVRMIVASFLTKHLLIDWRWGESYFAEKLLDYDLSANNGGWQWAAGTGCDAAPYFRVFNPYLQTQKFDPELKYIKKWVPEYDQLTYPRPIVEHDFARKRCLEVYKKGLDR
jgi:deoxyribodipyrimidine photo-lyase